MDTFVLSFYATIIAGIIYLARKVYYSQKFYRLAAELPGPPTWPIVGNAFKDVNPDPAKVLYDVMELLDEYDGFVRLWAGPELYIFISEPEDLELYFNSPKLLEKAPTYEFIRKTLGTGLFTANVEEMKRMRKDYLQSLTPSMLRMFVPVFVKRSNFLAQSFLKEVGKPEFNAAPYILNGFFAMICESALDHDPNFDYRFYELPKKTQQNSHLIYERMGNSIEHSDLIFYRTSRGKAFLDQRKFIRESIRDVIRLKKKNLEELKANSIENNDIRGTFIYKLLENPNMTEDEMIDHIATMIMTGFDTSASTIIFSLMMLGKHQEIQERVYKECMALYEKLGNNYLQVDDLEELEYTERVLKETLRLFPIGPILGRCAGEDMKIGKYIVPKGTTVNCAMIKTNRNHKIYPDPLKFDPDRFLPEECEKRHKYAYVPFSSGPRSCIGTKYAWITMKTVMFTLMRNYKVFCNKNVTDVKLKGSITLQSDDGCLISLEKRHDQLLLGVH